MCKAWETGEGEQVGEPANSCVLRASSSRGLDSSRKVRGREGRGLAWRGFCALRRNYRSTSRQREATEGA